MSISLPQKEKRMHKILVIEDERVIKMNLLKLLSAEGFQTLSADDGISGLKLAQAELAGFDYLRHPDA
jgi:DNA-binding response OmpR family regulator